ncbi:hypothetical protein BDV97DRAFT_395598 [Delphinella strobiligena]|nr:hypothetical protein BDV97DRAFT_395598 [Delphinella strobiligena]
MSGALSSYQGTSADFLFSSPRLEAYSVTSSGLTLQISSSSYSVLTFDDSPISLRTRRIRSSTSAIYQSSSHEPPTPYRDSVKNLPTSIMSAAARPASLTDSSIASNNALTYLFRCHSAPNISAAVSDRKAVDAQHQAPILPDTVLESLLAYLDYASYKALRLTCRSWSASASSLKPLHIPIIHKIPIEIIQTIFQCLSPLDFKSAKSTCEAWYEAGRKVPLLVLQLRRGGWMRAAQKDLESVPPPVTQSERYRTIERTLRLRLDVECSLTAGHISSTKSNRRCSNSFYQTATIDFTELHMDQAWSNVPVLLFNVSTCGRFLLVARDRLIFIYAFRPEQLQPVCKVVCPRRVLAMSMDASYRQHVVAALLEGRTGILADLADNTKVFHSKSHIGLSLLRASKGDEAGSLTSKSTNLNDSEESTTVKGASVFASPSVSSSLSFHDAVNVPDHIARSHERPSQTEQSPGDSEQSSNITDASPNRSPRLLGRQIPWRNQRKGANRSGRHQRSTVVTSPKLEATFPFVSAPKSVYRHLGSELDPPRSVAICPSLRCVAFGCSCGMELHWVDAVVRQQELNRWFPLASPADFLYFFPYRQGVDSTKKLRIISSAADEERHILRRLAQKATSSISNIWPTKIEASFTSPADQSPRASSDEQDHRRAVPLSDGHHIIFMDPSTNLLCIGSDGPLGGPSKLARLVILVPPDELVRQVASINGDRTTPLRPPRPTAYAVAPDLSRGARVAAAYGDEVVFYSVPSDIFAHSFSLPKEKPPSADLGTSSIPALHNSWLNEEWLDWWPASSKVWSLPPAHDKSFPLHIQGISVGIMEKGVSDVAVLTGQQAQRDFGVSSEIVVWAFSRDGQSGTAWALDHDCPSVSEGADAASSVVKMKVGPEGGIKTIIES